MSEIWILNLCHKKSILVDIYRQSLLINVFVRSKVVMPWNLIHVIIFLEKYWAEKLTV